MTNSKELEDEAQEIDCFADKNAKALLKKIDDYCDFLSAWRSLFNLKKEEKPKPKEIDKKKLAVEIIQKANHFDSQFLKKMLKKGDIDGIIQFSRKASQ